MQVRQVMTSKVHTLAPDQQLFAADGMMHAAHIQHVPVVDRHGTLVGVLSDRDVLRASVSAVETRIAAYERQQHLRSITVGQVMAPATHVAAPETTVRQAAAMMRTHHIHCLPVVEHGRLVGIVTAFDLLGLVVHLADEALTAAGAAHAAV